MTLTGFAFLLAFFGGLALCVFRSPLWGLYTYMAAFYLHPPSRWWGAALPDLRWSLLAALVTLACVVVRKRGSKRAPFFAHACAWIMLCYVAWMWAQTVFVISDEHIVGAVLFTKYLVLLYLIYEIVDSHERVRDFLLAHIFGCFYMGWLAFEAGGGGRLEGVGGPGINDANTMAMHLGTGVIAAGMLLMTERGWRFCAALLALPFMLNGMILANSRGAFIGMFVGGLCLYWLKPPLYRKYFFGFGALGVLLFSYLANDLFWQRMSTLGAAATEQAELDNSAKIRLVLFNAQLEMFLNHPFGAGHEGTTALSTSYLAEEHLARNVSGERVGRSSHNTFMSVLVDQGIPGVVLLIALLTWVWSTVGSVTRRSQMDARSWGYGAAVTAALTVAVVAGQFAPYLKAEVQFWLLGLLISLRSRATSPQHALALVARRLPERNMPDAHH